MRGSVQDVLTETSKQTRAGAVYDAIRAEVLAARIPPGTKMRLADYGERFDVSLAVVREAMGRLAGQGLLQANPQRGFSTLSLTVEDLLELTRARIVVETATLRESIARGDLSWESAVVAAHHRLAATPEVAEGGEINDEFAVAHRDFHVVLLAGSGNSHLERVASSLRDRSMLYQHWSYYLGEDPTRDVACEHRQLAELAVSRHCDAAVEALESHIQRTTDPLVAYIRAHKPEDR